MIKVAVIDASLFSLPYDVQFIRGLTANGCSVSFFCRNPRIAEGEIPRDINSEKIFYPISEGMVGSQLKLFIKVFEHLIGMWLLFFRIVLGRYKVVHFQWVPIPLLDNFFVMLLRFVGIRVYFTAHNDNPFHGTATSKLQSLGWSHTFKLVNKIQVHTQKTYDSLVSRGLAPARNIFIAPHGPLELFDKEPVSSDFEKEVSDFIVKSKIQVLIFGHLKKYNGIDILYEELGILSESERSKIQLVIAGKPADDIKDVLCTDLDGLDVLRIFKFLSGEELKSLLFLCKVVVFPYREIDASGALMLAMNFSCCCVVSNLKGFLEVVQDNVNGLVFDIQSKGSLAKILRNSELSEKSVEIGLRAKLYVETSYGWINIGRKLVDQYENC
jgi:glycosyltransferase involved in cell wall biosynthesis